MNNVCRSYIFSSFVYSKNLEDVNNLDIVKDCLQIKNNTKSVLLSNRGGWQSPIINENVKTQSLNVLEQKVLNFLKFVLDSEGIKSLKFKTKYWVNVNNNNDYNVIHNHGNLLLTAVYYPFVPENSSSDLILVRTDGGAYSKLCENQANFTISCTTNMLVVFSPYLFHYVTANNSKEDRVSIAFNISEED